MIYTKKDAMCVEAKLDLYDVISNYQVRMVKYNNIENLLNFNIEMTFENTLIKYDTRKLITLNDFLKKINGIEIRKKVLENLANAIENLETYLLKKENILLDLEYIFMNIEKYLENEKLMIYFIYFPLKQIFYKDDYKKQYQKIEAEILGILKTDNLEKSINLKISDKENILEKLYNENDDKNISQYKSKLKSIDMFKIINAVCVVIGVIIFKNNMIATLITISIGIIIYILLQLLIKVIEQSEYEDEFGDETMVIQKFPYIRKSILDEKIYINSNEFLIGKNKDANLNLQNMMISKNHAIILKKGYGYFVKDLNSTNNTYINDEKLEKDEERMLSNGDKIKFANEVYQFIYEN